MSNVEVIAELTNSLIHPPKFGLVLSPAYDMVNTVIVNPEDEEQLALILN